MLDDLLTPRIVELGKIKIGTLSETARTSKSGNAWRPPVKLDHFIITTMNRNASGLLEPDTVLMQQLAEEGCAGPDGKLREIPVALLSDDEEDVLQCAYVYYGGKKCWARSDGKTLTKYADLKTGAMLPEPIELPWDDKYLDLKGKTGAPLFKKHTVFNCVVSASNARWGGVYKFRTTSAITGDQLLGSLRYIKSLTGGVLSGMPLRLVVRPIQVAPEGKATTVYVVHLELRGDDLHAIQKKALELAQFRLAHREQLAGVQRGLRRLIVHPGAESPDEASDIQQEFAPDANGHDQEPDSPSTLLDDDPIVDVEPESGDGESSLLDEPSHREPGDEPDEPSAADIALRDGESIPDWHKRMLEKIDAAESGDQLDAIRTYVEQQRDAAAIPKARAAALLAAIEQQATLV